MSLLIVPGDDHLDNPRLAPDWNLYRHILYSRGYALLTFRDIKLCQQKVWEGRRLQSLTHPKSSRHHPQQAPLDENALCRDAGLPENMFRGVSLRDGRKVIVKAVHTRSRELDVLRFLSAPSLRLDPMNHTIPVLDVVEIPADHTAFVVQEEWTRQLHTERPSNLRKFLRLIRQCIEGVAFMHSHGVCHLDMSLRNILTDGNGRCAFIDFELSRRLQRGQDVRICGRLGTEIPKELDRGEQADPFKVDVYALGAIISRACQLTGYNVPELTQLIGPIAKVQPEDRPSARSLLRAFDKMVPQLGETRLSMASSVPRP